MTALFSSAPHLICEIANSHAGDPEIVRSLIREFGELRYPSKGIKFQVLRADTIALPDFAWYGVYEQLAFDEVTWASLIEEAATLGDVWIDVFDRYATEVVRDNLDHIAGLKLQASVLENEEVLSALRELDLASKQLMINVSGFELDAISRLARAFQAVAPHPILQIGFQGYPTQVEDTALQKIAVLRAAFPDCPVAMADHAGGASDFAQLAPLYAATLGCAVVEKHLCLARADAAYDGASALEPEEMQRLCDRLVELERGRNGLFIGEAEKRYLSSTVQVPIVNADVRPGERLETSHVHFRRTAQTGVPWSTVTALQRRGQRVTSGMEQGRTLSESHFGPARVAAIVACRMKSSRLPKKATVPIVGVSSVERCLYQLLEAPSVPRVVLATSTLDEDQVLEQYRCGGEVAFWAGDPDDVIARYLGACEHYGVDVIVRVTADCPLVSTEIVEHLLAKHFEAGADYTAAAKASVGTACEIIEASALRTVIDRMGRAEHSEYMTWYLRNNPEVFRLNIVDLPPELVRDYRLTLDHPEDLEVFEAVVSELGGEAKHFALNDVFGVLDANPEIAAKNAHIELKYVADQALISMLNEKTRLPPASGRG